MDTHKETTEKKFDSSKDYVYKIKEQLDGRIDNLKHYEEKMMDLNDDLKKHRLVTSTEQTKFMSEIKKTNQETGKLSSDFNMHIEAY